MEYNGIIACLLDRISSRLPHRTGSTSRTLEEDDTLSTTRAALVDLSSAAFNIIADALVELLEELSTPLVGNGRRPAHVQQSQRYIVGLLAQCCSSNWRNDHQTATTFSRARLADMDATVTVIQYVTATSWTPSFAYARNVISNSRRTPSADVISGSSIISCRAFEQSAIFISRALAFFWVDGPKLSLLTQEVCSNYPHFLRSCQNAVAIALPQLVTGWIERYPSQFTGLHIMQKSQHCDAKALFDMIQIALAKDTRKHGLYSLQLALALLIPDVFEAPDSSRDAANMVQRTSFLEGLRKDMRSGNEEAANCVVMLLHLVRHFKTSAPALVDYAVKVKVDVENIVFKQPSLDVPFRQEVVTGVLVSLAQLNIFDCVESVFENCIKPCSPDKLKIAVVQACSYFVEKTTFAEYDVLLHAAIPFMRSQFQLLHAKASNTQGEPQRINVELTRAILTFLLSFPKPLMDELSQSTSGEGFLRSCLSCILSTDPQVRGLAVEITMKICAESSEQPQASEIGRFPISRNLRDDLWKQGSEVVLDICGRIRKQRQISDIQTLRDILKARLILARVVPQPLNTPEDTSLMMDVSSILETTLLTSLCVADIDVCQTVTTSISILLEEESTIANHIEHREHMHTLLRNKGFYQELASRSYRFTGLVAFQKRLHSLFLKMRSPTAGILAAWVEAFDRWMRLAERISTASTTDDIDEKLLLEWRNFSGFLASLGGICTAGQREAVEDLPHGDYPWIDWTHSERFEEPLLTIFLRVSVQLLGCSIVKVRETMRDVLSSEISPTLHASLLQALELEFGVVFAGAHVQPEKELRSGAVFVEQAAFLLKMIVDGIYDLGGMMAIDLGLTTINLTRFLDSAPDEANTLRAKIRVCNLCEAVAKRRHRMNMRDDIRTRNQILEYIVGWMARPQRQMQGRGRHDGNQHIRKDLDKACLKCVAHLTFRLPLQSNDLGEAGMNTSKSQIFLDYFSRFLFAFRDQAHQSGRTKALAGLQGRGEAASDCELLVAILSNLLGANIDIGLKQCLSFGYHEDIQIRLGLVTVLHDILVQGTELSTFSDLNTSEKYSELVLTADESVPTSMSAVCPSSQVDELTMCLLIIFEGRGMLFGLFEALIRQEIDHTENEAEILRRTCVVTKMLSVFAKWKGNSYLRSTLQTLLERLMRTSHDLDLELDPARVGTLEELHKNATQLQIVAKMFMDDICASSHNMPPSFRKICSIIAKIVSYRFPNAKYTAVGAFVFLRFICPAIVAPESDRLVSSVPTKEMRRGLLLIAKIIQNLANNVLFGAKESYMFPLNPFLVQHIHLVTGFLREVAVPPDDLETVSTSKVFDFGSCVVLHRFLYDHQDPIRQCLSRRDDERQPAELSQGTSTSKSLLSLILKLGPPPVAVSWNRPQITSNPPPLYSRFQNFMFRNALGSSESFMTSRAVYDGGESKDGLSMVCIILRRVEDERIDYETLLYYFLKISSRLWREPFGIFLDATCYKGRDESPDTVFTMLEPLTTVELMSTLSRIYVYNMNSAFRRCWRRLLRFPSRSGNNVFHPKHADYYLISNHSELRAHFNEKQLRLPDETTSVVKDIRHVFQPVTRLSKTKGMVDVIIGVGSQFLQITTAQKQEFLPELDLSSTVTDIFRMCEVEEVAPIVYEEDEPAFGVRIDGGKVVVCFTSPVREDIVQCIRRARSHGGKDDRSYRSFDRLVRPQDVPGTMLNLALTNLVSPYHVLRRSSYDLLGALCRAFKFSAGARLVCTKFPLNPTRFIVNISKELARTEPHLTADFLTEFLVSWASLPKEQKPLSLEYLTPWLSGLRTNVLPSETDGDRAREKVAGLLRKLIDIVLDEDLLYVMEHFVWPSIAQDELILEIFLDELIKIFVGSSSRDVPDVDLHPISSIVISIGTVSLQGKVISRLRKAVNRSSLRPTRQLPDNAMWGEICVLLRFCLALSFDNGGQSQMFLPEVFHLVTLLSNTGDQQTRLLVNKFLINTLHAIASFNLQDADISNLFASLDLLADARAEPAALNIDSDRHSIFTQDSLSALATTQSLVKFLMNTCVMAAPSVDMANAWRARWMSLVASTAFQNNPAIQPRAFTVMGYLACDEVDDDLLYQVLVALRHSLARFADEGDGEMLLAIVASLSRMLAKPHCSRYNVQLFWLGIYLVQLVPLGLFNCIGRFLEAIMNNIAFMGNVRGEELITLLMQSRMQLVDAAQKLEEVYGVHFTEDTFHFAVCASLVRGFTNSTTRGTAVRVFSSFVEATLHTAQSPRTTTGYVAYGTPYMALTLARCGAQELDGISWTKVFPDSVASLVDSRGIMQRASQGDGDVLLMAVIELSDFQSLEDEAQARTLRWMVELSNTRSSVFLPLCGVMPQILENVLLHSQNSSTLDAAHTLLRIVSLNSQYSR
ncbi:hypothetical protein L249_8358 [Ophiocordyceps polyrhachis-furcata BCC 54312]|uniref:Ras-GAP domain-containing protein n=1 Tax=Ophiocordyceps polyrhachis-furcata BCC 54312 TaxID=1330021 RepID=A0A367L1I2_9HYPO|nr:hypothetical protein L249_8358 [Ophiocordyceps polyrhachis-furcata BCC 54312]